MLVTEHGKLNKTQSKEANSVVESLIVTYRVPIIAPFWMERTYSPLHKAPSGHLKTPCPSLQNLPKLKSQVSLVINPLTMCTRLRL